MRQLPGNTAFPRLDSCYLLATGYRARAAESKAARFKSAPPPDRPAARHLVSVNYSRPARVGRAGREIAIDACVVCVGNTMHQNALIDLPSDAFKHRPFFANSRIRFNTIGDCTYA